MLYDELSEEQKYNLVILMQNYPPNQEIRDGAFIVRGEDWLGIGSQDQARSAIHGYVRGFIDACWNLGKSGESFCSMYIAPFYSSKPTSKVQVSVLEEIANRGIDLSYVQSQFDPVIFAYVARKEDENSKELHKQLDLDFQVRLLSKKE